MKLTEIIKKIPELKLIKGDGDLDVGYIWADSRKLKPNDVFVLPEDKAETIESYLQMAYDKGVKVVLVSKRNLKLKNLDLFPTILESEDALGDVHGKMASQLLGNPSKKLKIIGITGTNGKTSLTFILFHIAKKLKKKVALIGTVQIQILDKGYVTEKEFKKLSKSLKNVVTYNSNNEDDFHVKYLN